MRLNVQRFKASKDGVKHFFSWSCKERAVVDKMKNVPSASFTFASRSGLGFWVHLVAIFFKVVVSEYESEDLCFRSSRVKLPQLS